ncbi:DUF2125 domain-containing protein [Algicella marina]|uniref:DUF2125 domain-containing protein n=1 Tax=Algicella marina TaxID=2683284 RepID=A0A6P1SW30_9RHOB|nr:DUF2125 domain-containing protein [Algicella marina]QHQ33745.1 DUF2125 domain-containing protein [Algicella marina]
MRKLFFLVILLAAGWAAYWFVGSTAQRAALESWFAQQRQAGWVAEYEDLSVAGFPNRFDSRFTGLDLADPGTGWAWEAPHFNILALSYQPNKVITVFPPEQVVRTPVETLTVVSQDLRASVHLEPNTLLGLKEAILAIDGLGITSDSGWATAISSGQLSVRRSPEGNAPDFSYDVALDAADFRLPEPLRKAIDPAGLYPVAVTPIYLRMTPVYDAPWDRLAAEGATPALTALNIQNLSVTWGELEMQMRGSLDIDTLGRPEGSLNLVARNWPDMLQLAVTADLISADLSRTLERGLSILAQTTGETSTLDLPLRFEGGFVKLGPVPIGRAPVLVYRP